jgi:hypothetical protein
MDRWLNFTIPMEHLLLLQKRPGNQFAIQDLFRADVRSIINEGISNSMKSIYSWLSRYSHILSIDLLNQGDLLARARDDPKVVYPLDFIGLLNAHAPSLPDIPQERYLCAITLYLLFGKSVGDFTAGVSALAQPRLPPLAVPRAPAWPGHSR